MVASISLRFVPSLRYGRRLDDRRLDDRRLDDCRLDDRRFDRFASIPGKKILFTPLNRTFMLIERE